MNEAASGMVERVAKQASTAFSCSTQFWAWLLAIKHSSNAVIKVCILNSLMFNIVVVMPLEIRDACLVFVALDEMASLACLSTPNEKPVI